MGILSNKHYMYRLRSYLRNTKCPKRIIFQPPNMNKFIQLRRQDAPCESVSTVNAIIVSYPGLGQRCPGRGIGRRARGVTRRRARGARRRAARPPRPANKLGGWRVAGPLSSGLLVRP